MLAEIDAQRYDTGPRTDALAPATFVDKINVPVFLAGSWQDEETGAHFADMLDDFAPGVPVKFTLMNGVHSDALGPAVIARWAEFLDFYVARRIPTIPADVRVLADGLLTQFYGPGVTLPPDRFTAYPDYATALAAYEQELPVRVLFDIGAGGAPGTPDPRVRAVVPVVAATDDPGHHVVLRRRRRARDRTTDRQRRDRGRQLHLRPVGLPPHRRDEGTAVPSGDHVVRRRAVVRLEAGAEGQGGRVRERAARRRHDDARHRQRRPVAAHERCPTSTSRSRSPRCVPTARRSTCRAAGSARARARSTRRESTALLPVPTYAKEDAEPLPKNKVTLVRVPIVPVRPRVRRRLAGTHRGATARRQPAVVGVRHGAATSRRPRWRSSARSRTRRTSCCPSIPGVAQPEPASACDSLRGQPCRPYSAG